VVRTEVQLRAAWSLYVEYATRISTQPLEPGHGSIREALGSLHALFDVTRTLLKDLGPGVAEGPDSVGPLAIRILNNGVRPFLVEWHTKLSAFETEEALRQQENLGRGATPVIDEATWRDAGAFYDALESFRSSMLVYVGALETLAGLKEPA
jgi:hypothetical protein